MKVIIAIPAWNEERTLPKVIEEIKTVMQGQLYKWEILVTDDGSTDKTKEVAKKQEAIVAEYKHRGLAETFKSEMQECVKRGADIIVHTDADGQYHPQHIPQLIAKVQEGYDLVLGSRFKTNTDHLPWLKKMGNKAFARVISSLVHVNLTDTTTGFRAFTVEVAREINFINSFTYTQEQIIKAAKQGFKITEIPIIARRTRASRLFKNPWEYALRAWINILRIYRDYEPLQFFGRIGLTFLGFGILIGIWLTLRFIYYGSVGRTPSTLLCILLILIGIQIILFGFLADMKQK